MKQRVLLPFGGALERGAGTYLLEPSSFNDIRNVHLQDGRVRVRRGLAPKGGGIAGATDILAVSPIRGTRRSLAVAYSSVTRQAWLVTIAIDPSTLAVTITEVPSGTLWTLNVNAAFPRVSIVDSFTKAFIAHDEPVFQYRQPVKVFDAGSNLISNLTLDGSSQPMQLRGMARHLQYVIGWGYGFDTTDQRNRPETLRFSLPGDTGRWDANWYMLLGQRGEPIVGGGALPSGFVAAKENELHLVVGQNPATFDSLVIDPFFGQVSANAGIVVGDTYYFWSAEGPRATQGGQSAAIGDRALDLRGEIPDAILDATDFRSCFAVYRPEENEIEWCFPAPGRNATWAYAIHLDGQRDWTYRPYSAVLRCAGMLQGNVALDPADPALTPFPAAQSLTLQSGSWYSHTFVWNNNNLASLPSGAVAEVWAANGPSETDLITGWSKVTEALAAGGSQSVTLVLGSPQAAGVLAADGGLPGNATNAAIVGVRYRLADGSYYSGYASANPLDWPSGARRTLTKSNAPGLRLASGGFAFEIGGSGIVDESSTFRVTWQNLNLANLEAGSLVEIWLYGSDTLPNVAADQITFGNGLTPNGWQLARTVAPVGASQTETGLFVLGRWKFFMLRVRHGGFAGAARFLTGASYGGDWTLDPNAWRTSIPNAASFAQLPVPTPRITNPTLNASGQPTFTIVIDNAGTAPAGQWYVQVLATSLNPFSFQGGVPQFQYSNTELLRTPASGIVPSTLSFVDTNPRFGQATYRVRLFRDNALFAETPTGVVL